MKKIILPALAATIIISSAFTLVSATNWKLKDENYAVKFTSPKVEGVFKGLKTEIVFDENNLAGSSIKATIQSGTVNTGNGMRNKHAKEGLGADQYATISFASTSIAKTSTGYEATGNLTIKDVTKEIKLPFTFTKDAAGGTFAGKFSVVPSQYHVDKSGTPELIEIELNVPVVK